MTDIDWDAAYSNAAFIPGAAEFPPKWARAAEEFRRSWPSSALDQPYGERPRERFDLFLPDQAAAGCVIFVHGGYWMSFDKSSWSHLAAGPLARGWAVAMPSYDLCPDTSIPAITGQIGRAVSAIGRRHPGPLRLVGHSAGGHLVSRMNCADSPLDNEVRQSLAATVSVSGLHDLRPLLRTKLNDTFGLDEQQAALESPALLRPFAGARISAWVGGAERPEFLRQTQLLADSWSIAAFVDPGRHHFDVIEALADPSSALTDRLLD